MLMLAGHYYCSGGLFSWLPRLCSSVQTAGKCYAVVFLALLGLHWKPQASGVTGKLEHSGVQSDTGLKCGAWLVAGPSKLPELGKIAGRSVKSF